MQASEKISNLAPQEVVDKLDTVFYEDNTPQERRALVEYLQGTAEGRDGLDRIYHHAGKPWAKVTTAAVAIRMTIEDALAGREPRFNSMLMRKNKTLAKQIRKRGPEAIWRYLNERGFIGNAAKCVNDVNGSYLSCHPSDDCAEFCYACKKNYTFANSAVKSELIYWAVKKDRICTIIGKFSEHQKRLF